MNNPSIYAYAAILVFDQSEHTYYVYIQLFYNMKCFHRFVDKHF